MEYRKNYFGNALRYVNSKVTESKNLLNQTLRTSALEEAILFLILCCLDCPNEPKYFDFSFIEQTFENLKGIWEKELSDAMSMMQKNDSSSSSRSSCGYSTNLLDYFITSARKKLKKIDQLKFNNIRSDMNLKPHVVTLYLEQGYILRNWRFIRGICYLSRIRTLGLVCKKWARLIIHRGNVDVNATPPLDILNLPIWDCEVELAVRRELMRKDVQKKNIWMNLEYSGPSSSSSSSSTSSSSSSSSSSSLLVLRDITTKCLKCKEYVRFSHPHHCIVGKSNLWNANQILNCCPRKEFMKCQEGIEAERVITLQFLISQKKIDESTLNHEREIFYTAITQNKKKKDIQNKLDLSFFGNIEVLRSIRGNEIDIFTLFSRQNQWRRIQESQKKRNILKNQGRSVSETKVSEVSEAEASEEKKESQLKIKIGKTVKNKKRSSFLVVTQSTNKKTKTRTNKKAKTQGTKKNKKQNKKRKNRS